MTDPFDLCDAVIRDLPHVRVTRHAPRNGRPCEYRKAFKAEGLRDANYWTRRENDFLLDFRKLRHTVRLSSFTQNSDGQNTPVFETVATYDAGITIEDWLRVKPKYANGETYAHPFKPTGLFLLLIRACLTALKEIHAHRLVHCDIKTDNICLPYSPYPFQVGKPVRIDFKHVRLIDFAFAIRADRPLEHPLPIEAKADYQSNMLKAALQKDLGHHPGETLHAQQLDYRADLYSLGFMADHILHLGLLQPQGTAGRAAQDGAHRIVERLKAFDDVAKPWNGTLPHDGLIADIDALLAPLTDMDSYRDFNVDSYQDISACAPTPMAPMVAQKPPDARNAGHSGEQDSIEKQPDAVCNRDNAVNNPADTAKKSHGLWIKIVEALLAATVTGLVTFAFYGLQRGYWDWTGICQLTDNDRQIRHCLLFGENPSHYPPSSVEPKKLLSNHSENSKDKSLRIGIDADKYRVGDTMKLQISVAKPLFVNVIQRKVSGSFEAIYRKTADKPVNPGEVVGSKVVLQGPQGKEQLIAIASEQPIPEDIVPIDKNGKLTPHELELEPIVVRLDYAVDPAPPYLECSEGAALESFRDAVDALWPRVKAQDADAAKTWNSALNKLNGILLVTKPSPSSRQSKVRALGCLSAMGQGKDGRANDAVKNFKQEYANYRESNAFVDWLIALETRSSNSPPRGYALWWENGYALAANGDKTAREDQADVPKP